MNETFSQDNAVLFKEYITDEWNEELSQRGMQNLHNTLIYTYRIFEHRELQESLAHSYTQ